MAFFLFAVAAACPTSSSASETGCLHVPSAAVGSAFECADLCGPNATLACISSEAESAFVTRRWPGAYLWLGAYRARAVDHWHCASGGQLSYVNWGPGKPSPQSQRPNTTSCAEMFTGEWQGKAGRWYDTVGVNWEQPNWVQLGCLHSLRHYQVATLARCLCRHGSRASSAYLHLALLPGRDPSHALCVKVGGDRPSFDPAQCVNVGGDRPAWRPPSNLTVTAVSELKIGKIFFGRPNDEPRRGRHH